MTPRCSLDDKRFLRLVGFLFVAGVDGVLRGVLGKSLVIAGYIT